MKIKMKQSTTIGRTLKPGFVKKIGRGKFLSGTIRKYGNKKGIVKKVC